MERPHHMYDDFQIEHQYQTSFPTCPHDFGLPLLTATKIWTIPTHAKLIGGVPSKEGGSQIMPSVPLVISHPKVGMKTTHVRYTCWGITITYSRTTGLVVWWWSNNKKGMGLECGPCWMAELQWLNFFGHAWHISSYIKTIFNTKPQLRQKTCC